MNIGGTLIMTSHIPSNFVLVVILRMFFCSSPLYRSISAEWTGGECRIVMLFVAHLIRLVNLLVWKPKQATAIGHLNFKSHYQLFIISRTTRPFKWEVRVFIAVKSWLTNESSIGLNSIDIRVLISIIQLQLNTIYLKWTWFITKTDNTLNR